jgi:hypothetical protein
MASAYQDLKLIILKFLWLTRDAVHVHVGFFSLVATLLLVRWKLSDARVLLPGFALSVMMEVLDFVSDYQAGRSLQFLASAHDLVNTNLIPLVLVVLARFRVIRV